MRIKESRSLFAATFLVLIVAIGAVSFSHGIKPVPLPPAAVRNALPPLVPQGDGYAYRRTITIDHAKVVNSAQTNFPLLVSGTYSYLATPANGGNVQNANGYDVIFTSDSGCTTKLDHEVETYNATTGAVNYWVRLPSLSNTTDTTLYLLLRQFCDSH